MKKMRISKKNRVKILSLMLTICMVISCLPVNIIAASSEADLTEKTNENEELINELLEPIIVEEDVSKRGENEKHFLCDDGSYIAITYSDKVHEIVNNEWVDIEYDVEDDGKEISPKDEKIKVKFANNTNSSKLVKIDADGYKISWTVEAETEDGEGINKVKLSKESKSVLKTTKEINKQNREKIKQESKYGYDEVAEHKNAAKKELKKYDLAKTKDLDKNEAVVFANNNIEAYNRTQIQCAASYAQSMIEYKDAFGEGHTLRYMLTEGSINEEIVLDSYKGFKSYSMVIDTDGLTPVVNEYGKVELTDADGKVIMYIDAPYMYDAADAISENITVTAEQENKKTWRISYTPDQEWLTSEDRVYPVVIDPTVSTRNYPQTSVLDAFVYNGQTDYSDRNLPYLRVGYTTGKIAHISYWGVNQLPSLPNNAYMTGAGLYIRFTNDTEDSENIAIYSTSGTLNTAAMNWASRPSVGSFLDNQASFPSGYWVNFCSASFGEKVRDAYRYGTPIAFAMKYADGSSKYQYNEFYSADCADTSYRPYLSVKYTLTFADVAEGDYYIRNLNSGKCLSVRTGNQPTAGTTVTQYEFSGSSNQVWTLSKTSGSNGVNNAYHLTPKNATGLCLYYSASTIRAQIHNYPEYDRSKWRFEEISTGVYSISSAIQPWLALDVDNYSTQDGADVYVYAYHGNDNQLWVLEAVGTRNISINSEMSGTIVAGGAHWYKYISPSDDYYNLSTNCSYGFEVEVYDEDYNLIKTSILEKFDIYLNQGDIYYIRISNNTNLNNLIYGFKIESAFIDKLRILYEIAKDYTLNDYQKSIELTCNFMRATAYYERLWSKVAGAVDAGFVDYVKSCDLELSQNMSKERGWVWYAPNGEIIDIPHLFAVLNVCIHDFEYANIPVSGILKEYVNALGGWAGDLRSVIPTALRDTNYDTSYDLVYAMVYVQLGVDGTYFSMFDMVADVDAENIYNSLDGQDFITVFESYYLGDGYKYRYTSFVGDTSAEEFYVFAHDILAFPFLDEIDPYMKLDQNGNETEELFVNNETKIAACQAFVDFLYALKNYEVISNE